MEENLNTSPEVEVPAAPQTPAEKPKKKLNGDLRVFVIALLTSLITILVYHGVLMAVRCYKSKCQTKAKFCVVQAAKYPAGKPRFERRSCDCQQIRHQRRASHHHHDRHGDIRQMRPDQGRRQMLRRPPKVKKADKPEADSHKETMPPPQVQSE